jgi:hypothetical protein
MSSLSTHILLRELVVFCLRSLLPSPKARDAVRYLPPVVNVCSCFGMMTKSVQMFLISFCH